MGAAAPLLPSHTIRWHFPSFVLLQYPSRERTYGILCSAVRPSRELDAGANILNIDLPTPRHSFRHCSIQKQEPEADKTSTAHWPRHTHTHTHGHTRTRTRTR